MKRKMPKRWTVFILGVWYCTFAYAASGGVDDTPQASINRGKIEPRPMQVLRGWGMSLAWEANDVYGGGRQPARITDPKVQSKYMDLFYGDPATRLTLGFTIARYNIAGGDDPAHTHMRADAQMEGYKASQNASFDWTRDASQRRMLQEAKKRGANIFEAVSYSPPYWMTVSGCSSGSNKANQDNLRPEMRGSFVDYLVTVVKHFNDAEGIRFESVEPFNEPDGGWWRAGGSQEGYTVPVATQDAILPMLANRLKAEGLSTFVAGVDTNNIVSAVGNTNTLSSDALAALNRFNTHDYRASVGELAYLKAYRAISQKLKKPTWMSELGCCYANQGDKTEMWGALFMADSIRMDLRDMGADAWVLWQPDWGVVAFDPHGGEPQLKKQYYGLAQYSRFIRPGFEIISAGGAYHTLAAYSATAKRLVLVTTNWDTPSSSDLDISAFTGLPSTIMVYRTTADSGVNLREETIALSSNKHIVDLLPTRSITTYVIDGVTPLPNAPVDTIEGTHAIVSQATGLCLNITTNSTQAGAAVIPWTCGTYTNEQFNLVHQSEGFYSIHTVNSLAGLCLNISNGTASPGDGKTPGGQGNLIQWSCGETSLPANEYFRMERVGADSYSIRVKSSGLCLEDPGRGGTIRQNRCDPTSLKQQFKLL
jgi:O-glycosyl hydrolase